MTPMTNGAPSGVVGPDPRKVSAGSLPVSGGRISESSTSGFVVGAVGASSLLQPAANSAPRISGATTRVVAGPSRPSALRRFLVLTPGTVRSRPALSGTNLSEDRFPQGLLQCQMRNDDASPSAR